MSARFPTAKYTWQGVLQTQIEAEAEAMRELQLTKAALNAERLRCADLEQVVSSLRSQLGSSGSGTGGYGPIGITMHGRDSKE